jgi:hypothetical protein
MLRSESKSHNEAQRQAAREAVCIARQFLQSNLWQFGTVSHLTLLDAEGLLQMATALHEKTASLVDTARNLLATRQRQSESGKTSASRKSSPPIVNPAPTASEVKSAESSDLSTGSNSAVDDSPSDGGAAGRLERLLCEEAAATVEQESPAAADDDLGDRYDPVSDVEETTYMAETAAESVDNEIEWQSNEEGMR